MRIGEGGEEDVRDLEKELEEKRLAEEAQEDGAVQAPTDINSNNNNNINVRSIGSPMISPMTSPVNTLQKSNQYSTNSPIITDSLNDHNNSASNNSNRFNQSLLPPVGRQSIASNLSVSPLSTLQTSPASVTQSPRTSVELHRRMSGGSHGSLYGEIDHGAGSVPYLDEPMDLGELDEETINAIEQIEQQALLKSPKGQANSPRNIIKGIVIKEEHFDSFNDEDKVREVKKTRIELITEDPEDIDQVPTQPLKGIYLIYMRVLITY